LVMREQAGVARQNGTKATQGTGFPVCHGVTGSLAGTVVHVPSLPGLLIPLNRPIGPVAAFTLCPTVERHFNTPKRVGIG
jgi:hypothetical protein